MNEHEILGKLEAWINEIRNIISLAEEVSQRSREVYETRYRIEDELKELKQQGCFKKKEELQIEEGLPVWRNEPKSGMLKKHEVHQILNPLLDLLTKLITGRTGFSNPQSSKYESQFSS